MFVYFFFVHPLETTLFFSEELLNSGKNCWSNCNNQQGKCLWCGRDGWCCRKNWILSHGCDGTFGGETGHQCTLKPKPSNYEQKSLRLAKS